MKLLVLSRNPRLYSTERLRQAAIDRGHDIKVLDTLKFSIVIEGGSPELFYRGKMLSTYDAVIPRIGASITFYGCAVVRQFEQMGVFTLNSSHAITVSRDKLRSMQVLSRHDIGMPKSAFVRDEKDIIASIERIGGSPVIIKLIEGTQGVGVILAENQKIAAAIVETLHSTNQNVLLQKFVAESRGKDIRAFVVGNRVVAAMCRSAQPGEYRSNVHLGGSTAKVELDEEFERTAVKAAQIMGLRVAGVDILESNDGPQVLEVNSSPGLEGIEKATGVDVAGEIIAHLEEQASFPDIDLRQRLTLQSGYGVAEVSVPPNWDIVGKTLRETDFRDRDVLVLNITRQGLVIPNPRGSREIMAGDLLLCFGKLMTLRALAPPKRERRRKKTKTTSAAADKAPDPTAGSTDESKTGSTNENKAKPE